MSNSKHQDFADQTRPAAVGMRAEEYLRLLHPSGSHGSATLMRLDEDVRCARTYRPDALPFAANVWLDVSAYVSLHRFHGPRSGGRLAALNVFALDLDYRTVAHWQMAQPEQVVLAVKTAARDHGLPLPSIITNSGRGLAVLWLINELPAAVEPRWRAAQACLIELFSAFGADRACGDATRIFRVPETTNRKNGRTVTVLDGTLRRYEFDPLADAIYVAAGRPTRAELVTRQRAKEQRAKKQRGKKHATGPRGLAPAARFRQVQADLIALASHWGGHVPAGLRNTWLHLFATCLTHQHDNPDLAGKIESAALRHCAGLPPSEIAGVIRAAERRQAGEQERYFYSGARIAGMLGVSDALARGLGLKQIYSDLERANRRQERETNRRRAKGMVARDEYLAAHATSREKPWEAHGYSRATWYRRGCPPPPVEKTTKPARQETCALRETGLHPQQGGLPRRRPRRELAAGHQPLHLYPDATPIKRSRPARPIPMRADPGRGPPNRLPGLMPSAEDIAFAEEMFPGCMSGPMPFAAARAS